MVVRSPVFLMIPGVCFQQGSEGVLSDAFGKAMQLIPNDHIRLAVNVG